MSEIYESLPRTYVIYTVGANASIYDSSAITYLASMLVADTPKLYFKTSPIVLYGWSKNPYGVSVGVPTECIGLSYIYEIFDIVNFTSYLDSPAITFLINDTDNLDYYIVSESPVVPDINSPEWVNYRPSQIEII